MDIEIGDKLYFWNRFTNSVDSILVTAISSDDIGFQYRYNNELHKMTYEKAEGHLFRSQLLARYSMVSGPHFVSSPEPPPESCDNCQLRKSGRCSQLGNHLCEDFRPIPQMSFNDRHSGVPWGTR